MTSSGGSVSWLRVRTNERDASHAQYVASRYRVGAWPLTPQRQKLCDMNALHATYATNLVITSFGAGIGLVTAAIVLNAIVEALRRLKRRDSRPALSDNDLRRLVLPQRPVSRPSEPGRMPMVSFKRQG